MRPLPTTALMPALLLAASACFAAGPVILIHGGAGTLRAEDMDADTRAAYEAALHQALAAGWAVLDDGGSALDAVTAAILPMEDSPLFNAGRGAVYNRNTGETTRVGGMSGEQGAVVRVGDDIYGSRDGEVYRRGEGGWEQATPSGDWKGVSDQARTRSLDQQQMARSPGPSATRDTRKAGRPGPRHRGVLLAAPERAEAAAGGEG